MVLTYKNHIYTVAKLHKVFTALLQLQSVVEYALYWPHALSQHTVFHYFMPTQNHLEYIMQYQNVWF